MADLYDEFHYLLAGQRQKRIIEHKLVMLNGWGTPIPDGVAIVDYYEDILGRPLNGTGGIIEKMAFLIPYKNCIGCGTIYRIDAIEPIGNIFDVVDDFRLPDEFDIFHIRPGFCDDDCIKKRVFREYWRG